MKHDVEISIPLLERLFPPGAVPHEAILQAISAMETRMSAKMDELLAEVRENSSAIDSIIAYNKGLSDRLQEILDAGDVEKLQTVINDLNDQQARIAGAIATNTPVDPASPDSSEPLPPPEVPLDVSTATPEEVAEGAPEAGAPIDPTASPNP